LKSAAIDFARRGERSYLAGNVIYSDQAQGGDANHGAAYGFRAESKVFTLLKPGTAGSSIEKFISPVATSRTVCECKTFMLAVYYNAIRVVLDELHPDLFDLVFTTLTLSPDPKDDETILKELFAIRAITFQEEFLLQPGDWLYVANPSVAYTEFHVEPTGGKGRSGAAGGWNLVCVSSGPNMYLGLGLTDLKQANPKEQSLDAVLSFMNQEATTREKVPNVDADVKVRPRSGSLEVTTKGAEQERLRHLAGQKKKPRLYQLSAKKLADRVEKAL
jgi:hypothetical protein